MYLLLKEVPVAIQISNGFVWYITNISIIQNNLDVELPKSSEESLPQKSYIFSVAKLVSYKITWM